MNIRQNWASVLGRLRVIGSFEALSFLALVGVGMPLKYIWDQPLGVRILGPVHGALFLWLCAVCAQAVFEQGWSKRGGVVVFLAAFVPFGPFLIDGWLAREQLRHAEKAEKGEKPVVPPLV